MMGPSGHTPHPLAHVVCRQKCTEPRLERTLRRGARRSEAHKRLFTLWKGRHQEVVAQLHPADVLIDGMRGSSSLWYRVRVNLQHVAEADRPPQEELLADYDPWEGKVWPGGPPGR